MVLFAYFLKEQKLHKFRTELTLLYFLCVWVQYRIYILQERSEQTTIIDYYVRMEMKNKLNNYLLKKKIQWQNNTAGACMWNAKDLTVLSSSSGERSTCLPSQAEVGTSLNL